MTATKQALEQGHQRFVETVEAMRGQPAMRVADIARRVGAKHKSIARVMLHYPDVFACERVRVCTRHVNTWSLRNHDVDTSKCRRTPVKYCACGNAIYQGASKACASCRAGGLDEEIRKTREMNRSYKHRGYVDCDGAATYQRTRGSQYRAIPVACGPSCIMCDGTGKIYPQLPTSLPAGPHRASIYAIRYAVGLPLWNDDDWRHDPRDDKPEPVATCNGDDWEFDDSDDWAE